MSARGWLLFLSMTLGACTAGPKRALPPDQARALLIERNWIDRLPRRHDDRLHVFRFVPKMGGGVYQDRTVFAGSFELFRFESDGQEIRFQLPHRRERTRARFTIEPLTEPGPGGVDLRLTLEGSPRGPSVYYSWRQSSGDLDAELARLLTEVQLVEYEKPGN